MIQNILALTIVFLTTAYTLYSIVKSLTVKASSSCGGCSGCALKDHTGIKHSLVKKIEKGHSRAFVLIK